MFVRFVASRFARQLSFLLLLLAIVFTASLLVNEIVSRVSKEAVTRIDPRLTTVQLHINLIFIVTICAVVSGIFLLGLRLLVPRLHNFIFGSIGGAHARLTYVLPLILAIILPFVAALAYDAHTRTLSNFVQQYGPWLAVFGLFISVSGLVFSAVAMQDLRHVINTFEDFKTRFSIMLEDVGRGGDKTNYVRIMAYTPLPGALALNSADYDSLKDLILATESRVEVICLDEKSSREWMGRFLGKKVRSGILRGSGRLDLDTINRAVQEVENLIVNLENPALSTKRNFASLHPAMRGTMDDLPRFYAYFTNDRALVINPLYFPIDGLTAEQQPEELKSKYVELIGFETTDTYTLKNLLATYELVAHQLKSRRLQNGV